MPKRGNRKQAPGERIRLLNDQAAQYSTREDTNNDLSGDLSTRYTISGSNVPCAVTHAPASLQQVQNGFLEPAPGEGYQSAHHVEQEDELWMQPNSMQAQPSEDWRCTVDENATFREPYLGHGEMQFAKDWSAADQHINTDSNPQGDDMLCEDVLKSINRPAEMAPEVSMHPSIDFTDPYSNNFMSDLIHAGSAYTPPWSAYSSNNLERQQPQQGLSMPVDGSGTSTTSQSTHIEGTSASSFVIVYPPGMPLIFSPSQHGGELAGSNLTKCPGQQAPGIQFDYADLDQTNASARRDLQTPGSPQIINRSPFSPQNSDLLHPTQTHSVYGYATSTTGSTASAPDIIHCQVCPAKFSGRFRKGNLARHHRTLHKGALVKCREPTCNTVFKRQDACLKHMRKHHPGLAPDAVPRPERRKRPNMSEQDQYDQNYALKNVGSRFGTDL